MKRLPVQTHFSPAFIVFCWLLFSIAATAQVTVDWVASYAGVGADHVVADGSGNIYVVGRSNPDAAHNFRYDIVVLRYDMAGNLIWAREFDETDDATNGDDIVNYACLDPAGNLLLTGRSFLNSTGTGFITLKYDPDGNLLWKSRTNAGYEARRVACDASGNVYITGASSTTASARNYVTIKYDSNGVEQWVNIYNGPNAFDDTPLSLAVNSAGDVAVTGTSTGGITSFDIATILYETDGNQLWIRRYNGADNSDSGNDVAFGPDGDIYVAGSVFFSASQLDAILIKYNPAGTEQWAQIYSEPANLSETYTRLRIDTQGNALVTGYHRSSDFVTAKYDPDGGLLWRQNLDIGVNQLPYSMILDDADNVYVTGESSSQVATFKYNSSGVEQWSQLYDNSGNLLDRGVGIAIDAENNVIVSGKDPVLTIRYLQDGNGGGIPCGDITQFLARCRPGGIIQSRVRFSTPDYNGQTVTFLIDGVDEIVATIANQRAQISAAGYNAGAHTVELSDPAGCVTPFNVTCPAALEASGNSADGELIPESVVLEQNYPNPFNPSTHIRYGLNEDAMVSLKIYNNLGQEVATLVNDAQGAGYHSVEWNGRDNSGNAVATGIYIYTLRAGEKSYSHRMMLTK